MSGPLIVLADAPANPAKPVAVAKLGDRFKDSRYGSFAITLDDFRKWIANFRAVKPEVHFDLDHVSERGGSTEAAGWVKDLRIDGDKLMADVDWTPVGESAIREKRYRFLSPVYGGWRDEEGRVHKDVLRSVGLTNRPFLRQGMPALALSEAGQSELDDATTIELREDFDELLARMLDAESVGPAARAKLKGILKHYAGKPHPFTTCVRDNTKRFGKERAERVCATLKDIVRGTTKWRGEDQTKLSADDELEFQTALEVLSESDIVELAASIDGTSAPSDSRPQMPDLKKIAKALGLDENADEAKVLEVADELRQRPEKPEAAAGETKTLDEQAKDEGKVVLDAAKVAELEQKANAGESAAKQLADTRFEDSYRKALDEGRVAPVKDDKGSDQTKDRFRKLYDADAETAIATLDALKPIVSTAPAGSGGGAPAETPAGVDEDSHQLDQRVQARIREKGEDYPTALEAVLLEEERTGVPA